jgi:hypothetical protein
MPADIFTHEQQAQTGPIKPGGVRCPGRAIDILRLCERSHGSRNVLRGKRNVGCGAGNGWTSVGQAPETAARRTYQPSAPRRKAVAPVGRQPHVQFDKQAYEKAQSSLATALERQPLLLGAVGVAMGAAVAGAFRMTATESETMGKLSDDLKSDFGVRTEAVAQSLREASCSPSAPVRQSEGRSSRKEDFWFIVAARSEDETEIRAAA